MVIENNIQKMIRTDPGLQSRLKMYQDSTMKQYMHRLTEQSLEQKLHNRKLSCVHIDNILQQCEEIQEKAEYMKRPSEEPSDFSMHKLPKAPSSTRKINYSILEDTSRTRKSVRQTPENVKTKLK